MLNVDEVPPRHEDKMETFLMVNFLVSPRPVIKKLDFDRAKPSNTSSYYSPIQMSCLWIVSFLFHCVYLRHSRELKNTYSIPKYARSPTLSNLVYRTSTF